MKVYIVGGNAQYRDLFLELGHAVVTSIIEADFLCFTGGEDVTPSLYDDDKHPYTGNNRDRDMKEAGVFHQAEGLPMVGICRGAQFLNVMSGGRMYQHVSEHTRSHTITDLMTGETIYVSSTHHQMMMPSSEAVLVASSYLGGTREWFDGQIARKDVSEQDNEVVFYPKTKCLCFQPHPEFQAAEWVGMKRYFTSLLDRYLSIT